MKTITSDGPISVAENWTIPELVNAGWSEADIQWEGLMVDAVSALGSGDLERAKSLAGQCVRVARDRFDAGDPRLGASLSNYAVLLRETGGPEGIEVLLDEARSVWASCNPWVENMTAPRSARSSLFHMRMEQKHRETYEDRWRIKWQDMVQDARARVNAVSSVPGLGEGQATAALQRWRRECPAMLNDTRKLMAAVLLMLPG